MNIEKLAKHLKEFTLDEIEMIAEYDCKTELERLLNEHKLVFEQGLYKYQEETPKQEFIICTKQNNDFGSIWFANHELWDKETGFWVYSKISNTFNGFLSSLTIFEE